MESVVRFSDVLGGWAKKCIVDCFYQKRQSTSSERKFWVRSRMVWSIIRVDKLVTSSPLCYVQIIKFIQFIPSVSFHPYFQFILICVGPVAENCPPPVGGWEAPSPICSEFSSSGWETAGGRSPIDNQDQFRSIKELWRRQKRWRPH